MPPHQSLSPSHNQNPNPNLLLPLHHSSAAGIPHRRHEPVWPLLLTPERSHCDALSPENTVTAAAPVVHDCIVFSRVPQPPSRRDYIGMDDDHHLLQLARLHWPPSCLYRTSIVPPSCEPIFMIHRTTAPTTSNHRLCCISTPLRVVPLPASAIAVPLVATTIYFSPPFRAAIAHASFDLH
ncbi:hypothetical protein DEO72_LG11g1404 [Vigna unguiculata]|uniref:Uncharacterized protein n=1 Tax=Vigna unguiculata TaxID=3917 RepID=A0A4D6NP13_VIGUN|nr:hypothetical protein DEO72_LG11g1404 [Vigna unguiculata]